MWESQPAGEGGVLSNKAKYGIKALLVMAEEHERGPVLIADLAERAAIPKKFLESILLTLKNQGLLRSKKGKGGGYSLARSPETIALGDVIRILDGPLALVPCASLTAYRKCDDCADEMRCGIRLVMKEVRDSTARILDSTTLSEVLRRVQGVAPRPAGAVNFEI
jgi:Rrf2 family protein